ncbi:hypothetical protein ACROYT_G013508 [Oculina patagonica]
MINKQEQIGEIIETFYAFDENFDGNITLEELKSVMNKSGKTLSADDLKTVVTAMDDNGDRVVNYSEFEQFMYSEIKHPFTDEDDIKHNFKVLDLNGDGFISNDELSLVAKVFYDRHLSEDDIDALIGEADLNCDGKATYPGME